MKQPLSIQIIKNSSLFFLSLVVLGLVGFSLFSLALAITPAGTVIRNQATVRYDDDSYLSNEVDTVVRAVCLPVLTPNGTVLNPSQQVSASQGQTVYLPYTLSNAGNAPFRFDLGWAQDSSSAWTPENVQFFHDLNRNAQLDSGELELTSTELESGLSFPLVLAVKVPVSGLGESFISPTAACESGERDEDNYALIRATAGPALQVFKSVSKRLATSGDILSFEVRLLNNGIAPTFDSVTLTDLFTSNDFAGLAYVSSSVKVSQGELRFFDGSNWIDSEPSETQGLRVTVDELSVAEQVVMTFDMLVLAGAAPTERKNVAVATGPGGPSQVSVDFEITPSYQHHLGPIKNAEALPGGEQSANDLQRINRLIFGQTHCFEHSLKNSGNINDLYRIDLTGLPSNVSASLNTFSGEPLAETIGLNGGESKDFLLCLTTASLTGAFTLTLDAISLNTARSNLTFDQVDSSVSGSSINIVKTADIEGVVDADQVVTYTLSVANNNAFDLTDVVISDELQFLQARDGRFRDDLPTKFISASDGGLFDSVSRTVTWRFDRLSAGEQLSLELKVQMPAEPPKGEVFSLANLFTLSAQEMQNPLSSNTVFHGFPVINIAIDKRVTPLVVRVGEELTYTIEVLNPNNVDLALELIDKPDPRLSYVQGSAQLSVADVTQQIDPVRQADSLIWNLKNEADLILSPEGEPGDTLSVTYKMLVKPGAEDVLNNTAQVLGQYNFAPVEGEESAQQNSFGVSVASLEVKAEVIISESSLTKPNATLAGRVYFDVNQNDVYDRDVDLALPGARIVLSNGWQTLTDIEGRYSFRELALGTWSIMLDPSSAPFEPRPHPEALGTGYRHRTVLQGLSVTDFPLEPPIGVIGASRETRLLFGPLSISKNLIPLPEGVRVVLFISSTEPLPDLQIRDSVPDAEDKVFDFELFEGEQTLTYDLMFDAPLTDPNARWRYP